jgi:hypothetical protein
LIPSGTPESGFSHPARGARLIRSVGGSEGVLGRLDDEGVEAPRLLDGCVEGLGNLASGEVALAEAVADGRDPEIGEVAHHSITLGTAKKPMLGHRRIGEHGVADAAVGDDIRPHPKLVRNDGGHRLDAGHVDLLQLLDPADDVVELGHQSLDLTSVTAMRASLAIWRTVAVSTDMISLDGGS